MVSGTLLHWTTWSCVALLAALSLLPAEEMVRTGLGGHLEHAAAYAGTAFLIGLTYPDWGWKWPVSGLVTYAGVLEILQNFSPGRHPAAEDWLAGSIGVLLGISAIRGASRLWRR